MNVRIPLLIVGGMKELVKSKAEYESGCQKPLALSLAVLINIYDLCTISILSHKNADEKNLEEGSGGGK